jgi:hypothetical protein
MIATERLNLYKDYLSDEGYRPEVDPGGSYIRFRSEGGSYVISVEGDDEKYVSLMYPYFWSIDSDAERLQAEKAANAANARCKVAKAYVTSDGANVIAAAEEFLCKPQDFGLTFPRLMSSLKNAVRIFVNDMKLRAS